MNKIEKTIEYWKVRLSAIYGEEHILNIALYGSQNYNIDTPNSDVDVKAIYVPSLSEAITSNRWLSKEYHDENGQHCEIKDIREMCKMYLKQNINFLETLFTEYRWDNPNYYFTHNILKRNKEKIARCQPYYGIKSICGQGISAIKRFEKNPKDGKTLAKIIYFFLFLKKYKENRPYQECLKVNEQETILEHYNIRNMLIDLKLNNYNLDYCPLAWAKMIENDFEKNLKNIKEDSDKETLKLLKEEIPLTAIYEYKEK